MVVALLAVLGVDLIVIVALLGVVLLRKRWVKHQPDSFQGVIRVSDGEIDGLKPKFRHGYGRWVSDVLVWTKAPFLFRNAFVPVTGLKEQRPARHDEVKRLGDHPVVIGLGTGGATVEVAAHHDETEVLLGPYAKSSVATPTPVGHS